jgi:DNA repair photolyase
MGAKGEEILLSVCIKDQIRNMNRVIGCTVGCDYCYARNNVRRWHMIEDFILNRHPTEWIHHE